MLSLLKKKNPYEQAARAVYAEALSQTRRSAFYEDCGVPDSFDGRFDLLLAHIALVMDRVLEEGDARGEAFNQSLFDATFADMDQTLREMGIGDMGVPKHMRKMMRAFNGRMHVYHEALAEGGDLEGALRKNLYGTVEEPDEKGLAAMVQTLRKAQAVLKAQSVSDILAGRIEFEEGA